MRLVCGRPAYSTLAAPGSPAAILTSGVFNNEINDMTGIWRDAWDYR
jgi:hypothetical protein